MHLVNYIKKNLNLLINSVLRELGHCFSCFLAGEGYDGKLMAFSLRFPPFKFSFWCTRIAGVLLVKLFVFKLGNQIRFGQLWILFTQPQRPKNVFCESLFPYQNSENF